jgi:hypothetical protein
MHLTLTTYSLWGRHFPCLFQRLSITVTVARHRATMIKHHTAHSSTQQLQGRTARMTRSEVATLLTRIMAVIRSNTADLPPLRQCLLVILFRTSTTRNILHRIDLHLRSQFRPIHRRIQDRRHQRTLFPTATLIHLIRLITRCLLANR